MWLARSWTELRKDLFEILWHFTVYTMWHAELWESLNSSPHSWISISFSDGDDTTSVNIFSPQVVIRLHERDTCDKFYTITLFHVVLRPTKNSVWWKEEKIRNSKFLTFQDQKFLTRRNWGICRTARVLSLNKICKLSFSRLRRKFKSRKLGYFVDPRSCQFLWQLYSKTNRKFPNWVKSSPSRIWIELNEHY